MKANNCHIRGNTCRTGYFSWTCNSGGHNSSLFYQIYCTNSKGEVYLHAVPGDLACGVAPYGPDEDWIVIDDSDYTEPYERREGQMIYTASGCGKNGDDKAIKVDINFKRIS